MSYPEITQRAFNSPLLVEPRKAAAFMRGLGPRLLSVDSAQIAMAMEDDGAADPAWSPPPFASLLGDELGESIRQGWSDGYGLVEGVAVIAISGVLIHRGAWIGQSSGQTSYEGVRAQIDAAVEDPAVKGIALEIDCFGGEVAGCFDLADHIRAVAKIKPVRAFIAEHAYSAAYALAAQADKIIVPRSGGVGSIGVLCMHVDVSGAMKKEGVAVTLIHAGAHKVDGHPYAALPDDVRDTMQAEMEQLRQLFATTVGKGRGDRLDAAAALGTEAKCFSGADAVREGLADEVQEPRVAFQEFIEEINSGADAPSTKVATATKTKGGRTMATKRTAIRKTKAKAMEDDIPEEDEEDEPEAMEDDTETDEEAVDDDDGGDEDDDEDEAAPAAKSERQRISAIVNSQAAVGREKQAAHFAFSTNMSAKAAISALKTAPKANGQSPLSRVMGGEHPNLKPAGGAPAKGESIADRAAKRFK